MFKIKEKILNAKDSSLFKYIFNIIYFVCFIVILRWLGIKVFLGFLIGSFITAYLIISKNPLLNFFIEYIEK